MTEVNAASALSIRELTGQQRSVRLVGRALPYRPFSLQTKQRVEATWLPGSPEGTATVLGAEDGPTTINGSWKDKYLGEQIDVGVQSAGGVVDGVTFPFVVNGASVKTAQEAETLFDSICREGQLLQLTWNQTTRQGFLRQFDRDWHNTRDLYWTCQFEWIGRGEGTPASVFIQETSISDTASVLQKKSAELVQAAQPSFPVSSSFASELGTILTTIVQSVSQAQGAVSGLSKTSLSPAEASRRVVAACTGIVQESKDLITYLNSQVYYSRDVGQPMATMGLGRRIRAASYSRGMIDLALELRRIAIIRRSSLIAQMDDMLVAVYTARDGEDLRDVSRRFYGNVFEWRTLLSFNLLGTPELQAGQVLLVPKIQRNGRNA